MIEPFAELPCANCGRPMVPDNSTVYMNDNEWFPRWRHDHAYGPSCGKNIPDEVKLAKLQAEYELWYYAEGQYK